MALFTLFLSVLLLFNLMAPQCHAFVHLLIPPIRPTGLLLDNAIKSERSITAQQFSNNKNDNEEKPDSAPAESTSIARGDDDVVPTKDFDWDEFLDTPFFEPDKVLEDETSNPLLQRLASFVVTDYVKAEALLSGVFFVVLIVVAQEVLRMNLYGENYEPFSRSVLPGNLF